jgi:type IV pilus assembly protein PilM
MSDAAARPAQVWAADADQKGQSGRPQPPEIPTFPMAKRSKTLVGLDIDATGIVAASVAVNGRLRVEHAAVAPLESGIIRDGEVVDVDGLSEALRALYRSNKGLDKRVRVGLANQKIVVRVVDLPYLEDAKEIDAAVRFHAQDQLPMPLEHAVLDHQRLDVITDETGRRQRVLLVAARREMVERVLAALRGAGLKPTGIDLSAFAMVRALYRPSVEEEDEHVLYLTVSGLTNLAVARGTACTFARASGSGVEALAVELAERSQLTLEHAQQWLTHVGVEAPVETIEGDAEIVASARHILLDGVRRIAADVRSSLDFHRMQDDSPSVSRAVLTGTVTAIPGFATALASELGMPVQEGAVDGAPVGVDAGRLTVAAGLALDEAIAS